MRNDEFGRLLKAGLSSIALCEGKNQPALEDDLGRQIGVAASSIQRYKAGHIPPEPRTVEILAEAAVRRGFLSRDWLQRFLRAAGYPAPERLLDRLLPAAPARPRPPRVYANLPAPTYSQFVMRAQAFAEVLEGLAARSAAVLIVGLGGQGKTSLAREVAGACLKGADGAPAFDAAVWVSDKDRPGTTNLSTVLDEIARTLDYPGFTQFEHDEKRREVEQLLRKQKVLLIVDNFETITDGALLSWLLRLPEPSKVLITSREYSRAFRNSTMVAELRGMTEAEAQALIAQRLRMLQLDKKVTAPAEFEPLVAVTGGNPKAIEIALGLVKHERRPLQQVVDDLYAARGELFDDLFARAWSLLDEAARRVLMVMTFFPDSASGEAVAASADAQGYAFDRAVERLTDLALLDIQQADLSSAPRSTLHPLVRVFATARLAERPSFEEEARERWVKWYIQLGNEIDYCWDDLSKLDRLNFEQETAYTAFVWAVDRGKFELAVELGDGIEYFYYVRGIWDKRFAITRQRAHSARQIGNTTAEANALADLVQQMSRQGRPEEAQPYFARLRLILPSTQADADLQFHFQHAIGLYYLSCQDYERAKNTWQSSIQATQNDSLHRHLQGLVWIAYCEYCQGQTATARARFEQVLPEARKINYIRGMLYCTIFLAAIALDEQHLSLAEYYLTVASGWAQQFQSRRDMAQIQRFSARLSILYNNFAAARAALAEAIDVFERLGMRRELAEARAELARLDVEPTPLEL